MSERPSISLDATVRGTGDSRFTSFVREFDSLIDSGVGEARILHTGKGLMKNLLASDGWLPFEAAQPHADHYQQYPLYRCPQGRFSVVSFVWGPGQSTPIHDHTVWGIIGVLRGAEVSERYAFQSKKPGLALVDRCRLEEGMIDLVSPDIGDIHSVANAYEDRVSISIHIYGTDIGQVSRRIFDPDTGVHREFVSGYASPNDIMGIEG